MRRAGVCVGLVAVMLASMADFAPATTVRRMDLDALIRASDCVVYARAVGSSSFWDPVTSAIWTETEFLVLDVPKGRIGRTVLVTEPGGILGDVGHLIPGAPRFALDQEAVLFLYSAPGSRLRVTGLRQGVYDVVVDQATGERLARPAMEVRETVYERGETPSSESRSASHATRRLGELLFAVRQRSQRR